jgi:hypothetical protein
MNDCTEYCANYGCNQGRDCPARVARAKPIMKAADPLLPTKWRSFVITLAKNVLAFIAVWFLFAGTMAYLLV